MELEKIIDDLVNFRYNSVDIRHLNICPSELEDFLTNKGFVAEEMESNGWSVDFWRTFKKDNVSIQNYGNWFYGSNDLRIV